MISRMEFDCKIAHCDEIKRISGFNSIKELYEKISKSFSVPINEILFCTLNTHDYRDMDSLLGNYLSLGDLIVVHMCGNKKELTIKKTQEYLGLTITDNGNGRAFVKKVNSKQDSIEETIKPGDHIAAINSDSAIGMQHYEVAKAIREVPENSCFTLHLIEPQHIARLSEESSTMEKQDLKSKKLTNSMEDNKESISLLNFAEANYKNLIQDQRSTPTNRPAPLIFNANLDSLEEDLANSSLPIDRLLSKNLYTVNQNQKLEKRATTDSFENNGHNPYIHTIEKINSMLESFLGINDNTLAIQLYRLAKENKDSFEGFVKAIDRSELRVFNFDEDIESHLWNCAIESV